VKPSNGLPPIAKKDSKTSNENKLDNSFEMRVKYLEKQFGLSLALNRRSYSDDESQVDSGRQD